MLGDEEVSHAYAENAEFWISVIRDRLDPFQVELTDPAVLRQIGDPTGLVILDAGCGEGHLARQLTAAGARYVHGVDTCAEFIAAARSHPEHRHESAGFHHADVSALPLPDASVDLVVANRLPNGVRRPEERFREFARVLRPSGRLILLGMHPCFYVARTERTAAAVSELTADRYFAARVVEQRFRVAGRESPAASVQRLYSLEAYVGMIIGAGFVIAGLHEPHPTDQQRRENPWWDKNFVRPLFLLVECERRK